MDIVKVTETEVCTMYLTVHVSSDAEWPKLSVNSQYTEA